MPYMKDYSIVKFPDGKWRILFDMDGRFKRFPRNRLSREDIEEYHLQDKWREPAYDTKKEARDHLRETVKGVTLR